MRSTLITLLLLLGIAGAHARESTASADHATQVDHIIRASGLHTHLDQIPAALGQAGQQQAGMATAFVQPLISALQDTFNPDEMQRTLRADLVRQLDTATLVDAMRWYNSDSAKQIMAAEQRLAEPGVMDRIGTALNEQKLPGLTPARRQLLQELDTATQASDGALDMMLDMQAAFLSGFAQLITPGEASQFDGVRETFEASRAEYRDAVREQVLLQQAVLLEKVPDAALQDFKTFAASPSGQKLFTALNHSLDHTLRTAARKIPAAVKNVSSALRMEVNVRPEKAAGTRQPEMEVTPVTR